MTDFDQLIKEKVNKKEYPYSASSWHRFTQKAGLKSALTVSKSLIIGVASVAVIATGTWLGIRYFSPSPAPAPAIETSMDELPAPEPVLAATDTAVLETEETAVPKTSAPAPSGKTAKPAVKNEKPETPANTDTIAASKPDRKPILRPKNPRRILEIDPDTIKSND